MRTRLLSATAAALTTTAFAAEPPNYLPGGPATSTVTVPALVPVAPPVPKNDCDCNCNLTGGSTGLRPGVDCLPPPISRRSSRPRLYGELEYVLTWFDDRSPPPLVATAPAGAAFVAPLGTPGVNVLYGGDRTDFGGIDGLRATVGYWLDCRQDFGVEASGFLTERAATGFAAGSDGAVGGLVLARVIPAVLGPVLAPRVGDPGFQRGSIAVRERTRLWGAEGNGVAKGVGGDGGRLDLLAGFRYLDLDESLAVDSTSQTTFLPRTPLDSSDAFAARTQFYGGQIGARAHADLGRVSVSATAKVALGVSHLAVGRGGTLTTEAFVAPSSFLVPDPGRDTTDKFAVVPEGLLKVGFRLTERLEVNAGYSILYLSSAARAADQVNDGFAAKVGIDSTDFVAQGISLGLGYRY